MLNPLTILDPLSQTFSSQKPLSEIVRSSRHLPTLRASLDPALCFQRAIESSMETQHAIFGGTWLKILTKSDQQKNPIKCGKKLHESSMNGGFSCHGNAYRFWAHPGFKRRKEPFFFKASMDYWVEILLGHHHNRLWEVPMAADRPFFLLQSASKSRGASSKPADRIKLV